MVILQYQTLTTNSMKQHIYDTKATGKTHLTRDQQAEDNVQLRKKRKKKLTTVKQLMLLFLLCFRTSDNFILTNARIFKQWRKACCKHYILLFSLTTVHANIINLELHQTPPSLSSLFPLPLLALLTESMVILL